MINKCKTIFSKLSEMTAKLIRCTRFSLYNCLEITVFLEGVEILENSEFHFIKFVSSLC